MSVLKLLAKVMLTLKSQYLSYRFYLELDLSVRNMKGVKTEHLSHGVHM